MPELPEVETIKRQLGKKIVGKKLNGRKVVGVRRRAKILIIDFKGGSSLVFHLKLTGQLIFNGKPSKHTRKVFYFDDGSRLVFNDMRKFGWWKNVRNTKKIESSFGQEALDVNLIGLKQLFLKRPNAKIKSFLMDQKIIAGIGNIYSDEILFASGVAPFRLVKTINKKEISKIHKNIGRILKAAIKRHGSSTRSYLDAFGGKGSYLQKHKVYQKKNCPLCGATIKRTKIGGRSAHYCPKCQL